MFSEEIKNSVMCSDCNTYPEYLPTLRNTDHDDHDGKKVLEKSQKDV